MNLTTVMFVAIALHVVGSSMLAAEAIELCRLRRLSRRGVAGAGLGHDPLAGRPRARRSGSGLWKIYLGLLLLLGPVLADAFRLSQGLNLQDPWMSFRSVTPGQVFIDLVAAVPAAVIVVVVLSFFGSILIPVLSAPLLITTFFVEAVERHASCGSIGIMGFILILAGTTLKAFLELMGA